MDDLIVHSKLKFHSTRPFRVISIIGTRPETIKMFPIIKLLRKNESVENFIVLTGQHKDMVTSLLNTFDIKIDVDLNLMKNNQDLSEMTSRLILRLEQIVKIIKPDWILVQGDTTSAFIAGLVSFYFKVPVGHIEAGLRTFDRYNPFPEEMNRKLLSSLASLHFAPTSIAATHLKSEGINSDNIYITGNTVIDSIKWMAVQPPSENALKLHRFIFNHNNNNTSKLILITSHRRENLGQPLINICNAIKKISQFHPNIKFLFPMHLNPKVQNTVTLILKNIPNVYLCKPLDYSSFAYIMKFVYLVLTDSGGIQEESTAFSVPILILRSTTERPEGVNAGIAKLIGTDTLKIFNSVCELLSDEKKYLEMKKDKMPYGDGYAANKIVEILLNGKNNNKYKKINNQLKKIKKLPELFESKSLQQLKMMESFFPDNGDGLKDSGITAVISAYRRPNTILRIVNALLNQTVLPIEIWILFFASPHEKNYTIILDDFLKQKKTSIPIRIIKGDVQVSYFGRFQMALLAKTKFIAIFDDDVIPEGKNVFSNMLHTFNIKNGKYRGLYGCKGHAITMQISKTKKFADTYGNTFDHEPEKIILADVVGGLWFMKREWIKFMFIEDPITTSTSEDMQISALLSKYANIPTFLFPIDKKDKTSFLHSKDFIEIAENQRTTGPEEKKIYEGKAWDVHELRNMVSWWLFNRGQKRALSHTFWNETDNIIFFANTFDQAKELSSTFNAVKKINSYASRSFRPMIAISGINSKTDNERLNDIEKFQTIYNTSISWKDHFHFETGLWYLDIGRNLYGNEYAKDLISKIILSIYKMLENTQPVAFFVSLFEANEIILGSLIAARDFGVPIYVKDHMEFNKDSSKWYSAIMSFSDGFINDSTFNEIMGKLKRV